MSEYVIVTSEFLRNIATPKGGYRKSQLSLLGIAWPPRHGWKRSIVGISLPAEVARQVVLLRKEGAEETAASSGPFACSSCHKILPASSFAPKPSGVRKKFCRDCCNEQARIAREHIAKRKRIGAKGRSAAGGNNYQSRNAILRELGFASYADYLKSDLWKSIRAKVYGQKGRNCFLCGEPATELHHNRYQKNDLTGKRTRYINPICRKCHEDIEFNDGKKTTLGVAKRQFKRRRKEFIKSQANGGQT